MALATQNDRKDQSSQACLHVYCERRRGCRVSTDLDVVRPENPEDQPEDIEWEGKTAELVRRFMALRDMTWDRRLAKIRGSDGGGDIPTVNMSRCEVFGGMKQCACTVEKPRNLSGWSKHSAAGKDDIARARVRWKNQRPRTRSNREIPGRACSGSFCLTGPHALHVRPVCKQKENDMRKANEPALTFRPNVDQTKRGDSRNASPYAFYNRVRPFRRSPDYSGVKGNSMPMETSQ